MKNLTVRTLSGVALLALVLGATLLSKFSFGALLLAVMLGAMVEFYQMCRIKGYAPLSGIGLISAATIFTLCFTVFLNYGNTVEVETGKMALGMVLFLILIIPITFICELWHDNPTPIANVATTIVGVVYIALPMSMLLFVPLQLGDGEWNPWLALCYIAIIWMNDIFAYLVGVGIGKHRMCERISPKKSWEGFCGGIIAAVATGVLLGFLLGKSMLVWGGLAAVIAVTGVAGDFVESMFKRAAGIKDSGSLIPGHGGLLDRFDALIISAPFAFAYLLIVGNI